MIKSLSISRRGIIKMVGAGAALSVGGFPQWAFGDAIGDRRLVVVILRGAMDGLAAVPPYGDRLYEERRAGLALPMPGEANGIIPLDRMFGLNPALSKLAPLWASGELLVIPATGGGYHTRSHFDAQDMLETGVTERKGEMSGWLNRTLSLMPSRAAAENTGLAMGSVVPLILRGDIQVSSWENQSVTANSQPFFAAAERLYKNDKQLSAALAEGIKARNFSDSVLGSPEAAKPGEKGKGGFEILAHAAGGLLAAEGGPRVAVLDIGGWDTHVGQGTVSGRLTQALTNLQDGLLALKTELGPVWQKTVVVCVTEFGRTVAPNGTGGTDHGTASASFMLGGAIPGGRIAGDWVGLDRLEENRDLRVATDVRSVMKGILRDHLALPEDRLNTVVFPGSAGVPGMERIVRV